MAGVHNTTVSLALNNSPKLPEDTRKRIQQIAEMMGYRPDPVMRALTSYRKAVRGAPLVRPLFYLTHWEDQWGWHRTSSHARMFSEAQRRATELGYVVEHLWLGEYESAPECLARILRERKAGGVLIAACRQTPEILFGPAIDWGQLAAVQIGTSYESPAFKFNRVAINACEAVRTTLLNIRERGYVRIGFVLQEDAADSEPAWLDIYNVEIHRRSATDIVPGLILDGLTPTQEDVARLSEWHRKYRPDVIIGFSSRTRVALQRTTLQVPIDVAYVEVLTELEPGVAGIADFSAKLGALGVEMLARQIEHNEFGPSTSPVTILVSGVWLSGASLPTLKFSLPPMSDASPMHR